jgi:chromosome segregation ATPase
MSFLNAFYSHPVIVGCSLVCVGFTSGFAVNQYFSDHLHKVESIETGRLSNNVSTLQQDILSKDAAIQNLSSELAQARESILMLQNSQGSSNLSCQAINQKYSGLTQDYNQLSGMYRNLQANYQKSQQNCDALNRIGVLEQKRRNLENQLSSISYDPYEKDPIGKKQEIQVLLAQNHEQLLHVQRQLGK